MIKVHIVSGEAPKIAKGTAGLRTQLRGAVTVSAVSGATGGIKAGNLIKTETK